MVQFYKNNFSKFSKLGGIALCLVALAGCQTQKSKSAAEQPQAPRLQATATGVFGTSGSVWVSFDNPAQYIRFEGKTVSGHGGCNSFSAPVKINGAFISFGPVASTRIGCDDEIAQKEAAFFERLSQAHSFHGSSIRASVLDKSGTGILKFIQPR